ncbi:MAG: 30S ribosomal protein S18 [Planctomycetes bacterium]|nr:30S ribosomal protein S18 [Planctomycetota bacterium]
MSDNDKGGKFKKFAQKGKCRFCRAKIKHMDWKDSQTLARLSTGQGKLFSRKRSGNCSRHQRQFKLAVKHARFMALLPYVAK